MWYSPCQGLTPYCLIFDLGCSPRIFSKYWQILGKAPEERTDIRTWQMYDTQYIPYSFGFIWDIYFHSVSSTYGLWLYGEGAMLPYGWCASIYSIHLDATIKLLIFRIRTFSILCHSVCNSSLRL